MNFIDKYSETHLDVLREIANISTGHAATAISKLLNKRINIKIPDVQIVSFNEMMEMVGGADNIVVTVSLAMEGDAHGMMYYIYSIEQANAFVRELTGSEFSIIELDPSHIAYSAMQELGNIMAGSSMSALSDLTRLNIYPSVPLLIVDMIGAVLTYGLLELSAVSDHAIVIDTTIYEDVSSREISGHFFFLPDPDAFDRIFAALGV